MTGYERSLFYVLTSSGKIQELLQQIEAGDRVDPEAEEVFDRFFLFFCSQLVAHSPFGGIPGLCHRIIDPTGQAPGSDHCGGQRCSHGARYGPVSYEFRAEV